MIDDSLYITIDKFKEQIKELKEENVGLQRSLAVHNFLDTGVPQERLDYQRELKKEIIKLKSLKRRAAEEIRYLDDMLIDCVENNKVPKYDEPDPMFAGFSSINLLNRLEGRMNGGYVENYDDLHLELKTIDGYAQIDHPDFCQKQDDNYDYECDDVRHYCGGCGCEPCHCSEKPDEDILDDEEEALLSKLCDAVEAECFGEDFDYERKRMKKAFQSILDGESDSEGAASIIAGLKEASEMLEGHTPECKWYKDWHACDCGAFDNGGNTTERVEEQIAWLEKVAEDKKKK